MKNKITFLLLLTGIFAFSPGFLTAQDATATKILGDVSKTYKAYKTIKAQFALNVKQSNGGAIKQSGTLYLKGKKFRIDMTGQEIYCDGKTMWTYFKEENEVQISDYNPDDQEINPADIFTIYEKGFNYRYTGESIKGSKKVQQIELTPTNKNRPYFKVKLSIEKSTHKIEDMSIMNKNGSVATYAVTGFNGNININDTFFKFDEKNKPGVIVIKLNGN
ncbi:MAG: outer membrane lipoprotein-sorting protein [Bacteroidia bacterium]|jgi:outer membrane lipoprotein-sorting protein